MRLRSRVLAVLAVVSLLACGRVVDDGPTHGTARAGPSTRVDPRASGGGFTRSLDPPTKVDLLLAIDNSSSMGDKQTYLADAVPRLVERLLSPRCVREDAPAVVVGPSRLDGRGSVTCPAGARPEFPAVADLHVGVVTSSLGGRGGDVCLGGTASHDDDRGHLVTRGGAGSAPFLSWAPGADARALAANFSDRVLGVGQDGCGYEAQLESVYRFLIQPDPYASLVKRGDTVAQEGVDMELLAERRAFLRPDSLVAIVLLTDEDESSVAPGAFGGRAWFFEDSRHVRPGTTACATDPDSPDCKSCYLKAAEGDSACARALDDTTDGVNVRFFDMKRRFGVDPRYPVERYVRGLREWTVPSRDDEWADFAYVGNEADHARCTNPLFADQLPSEPGQDLCSLSRGRRTPDDVVLLAIGGAPWQLLSTRPDDLSTSVLGRDVRATLDAAGWRRLLGDGPRRDGQHPLMRPSIVPRAGVSADDAHGAEWNTLGNDLQYACMFPLPSPRDCSQPENRDACDCDPDHVAPVCDPAAPERQMAAKANPTLRLFEVARALGSQALVASACPVDSVHPTLGGIDNPRYGYRPAAAALGDRLGSALSPRCLAAPFDDACVVVAPSDGRSCHDQGLVDPPVFVSAGSVCAIPRQAGDCHDGRGFCVVPEGGACAFRVVTAPGTVRPTSPLTLACP